MKSRNKALNLIRMYKFALTEANLFLDTHPNDKEALEYLKKTADTYEKAVIAYTESYGPLRVSEAGERDGMFDWVKGPWPWEVEANVEL